MVREILLFLVLAILGLVVLPIAIFYVGGLVFGEYGGDGFGHFLESIVLRLAAGDRFAWLLILSPYVVLQLFRIMALAWRVTGSAKS